MIPAPRIARNIVWLALGDAVSRGGVFLFAVFVARSLGPGAFGVFTLAQSTTLYVWIAVDLGVNLYGAREVARAGDAWRKVAADLLGLRLAAAAVVTVVYVAVGASLGSASVAAALMLGCTYLVANALSLDWAAKGLERFGLPAVANALSATAVLVGYVAFVRPSPAATPAVAVWGTAYLAGALFTHLVLSRGGGFIFPRFDVGAWRTHLSASLFFAASGALLSAVQYAPVLALTVASGFDDLGRFSAAARLVTVAMSAGFLVPMAVYPALCRKAARSGRELTSASRQLQLAMAVLGVAVGGAMFLASEPLVRLLYGVEYASAVPLLRTLVWIVPMVFVRYSVGSVLMAAGEQRAHSLASLSGLVVTVLGCAAAVPLWGAVGVSVAWLAGEAAVAGLMAWAWTTRVAVRHD